MRLASMILGIVGGAITTLISFLLLFGSASLLNADIYEPSAKVGGLMFAVWGGLVLIGGVLGIVGGVVVRRRHILGGVLMIVASTLSFISMIGFLAGIILLIAGIFAFINDAPKPYPYGQPAPYGYAPYPPQPPAPPQQIPPNAIPQQPQAAPNDIPQPSVRSQTAAGDPPAPAPEEPNHS